MIVETQYTTGRAHPVEALNPHIHVARALVPAASALVPTLGIGV